nr:reverse transcriptase domain-containing protein [Tanacetum cinerariifolium]
MNNNQGPPPAGHISQNPALDLRTMKELCQPSMNGRGRPIAPVNNQATNFKLKNHMIQQVQQSCQYHGLPGHDANKHIDKFLTVTQSESFKSITSSSPEIAALTQQIAKMNTKFLRMSQYNQQVNVVNPSCETCIGPHHYSECQAAGGFTQKDVYAAKGNYNTGALTSKSNEIPEQNPHQPPIPYPSWLNKDKLQDKSDIQIHKFLKMFKKLHFNISFTEALAQMPKYTKMLKDLLTNKEKLLELANTPLNENCSAVLLKKLPEKIEDPGNFSFFKKLMLPELTPTCMTLELANRSVAYPTGIAEDVFVQVGKFTFPADFIIINYDVDPRVPLILGRPFLRTARTLVDVYGEELTLRVGDEKLIFNVESTSKYPHNHGDDPTPSSDPVVASLSPSLTPFRDSDFLFEETDYFLTLDLMPLDIDNGTYDLEGDMLFLEKLLEDEPSEVEKSKINPLIREPSDTFLMGDKEIKFNPLKDIDDPI